jgi:hypothetical protein
MTVERETDSVAMRDNVAIKVKDNQASRMKMIPHFNSPYAKDPKIRTIHDWLSIFLAL